uniref:F-box domain-containing protein n=2 Tax=Plectus sambesii TaxID=2011161 RepID=A0A914W8F6_9BILA
MPNLRPKRPGGKSHADVISKNKMEEVGTLLQNGPHLIKRILRVFSAREIHRVSGVCRTWQKYAGLVLKERRRVLTMIVPRYYNHYGPPAPPANVDNPEMKRFLRDLDMDCGVAFMFEGMTHVPSLDRPASIAIPPWTPSRRVNVEEIISCLTPSSVVIGALSYEGLISTLASYPEHRHIANDCLSAFLVPKSLPEGTHMSHFSLSLTQAEKVVKRKLNKATFAQVFQWPEDQPAKCIIMITTDFVPTQVVRKLLRAIRVLHDGEVALAGGLGEVFSSAFSPENYRPSAYEIDDDTDESSTMPVFGGLVFGGENVRAASLVIGEDDRTKESVRERLMELKAKVEAWGECRQKFGFVFASCIRGWELFHAYDVEIAVFKELMPDIPLNGMCTEGEYGWDFPLPLAQPAKKSRRSNDAVLIRTNSFAIVGFV